MSSRLAAAALLFPMVAMASITATLDEPAAGKLIGDSVNVTVSLNSTFQVTTVNATSGAATAALSFDAGDQKWRGAFDTHALPYGPATITIAAVNVMGETTTASVTVKVDRPPVLELLEPGLVQVARPTVRIHARCIDDSPEPCFVRGEITGPPYNPHGGYPTRLFYAESAGEVDATFGLCAYDALTLGIRFGARDSSGQELQLGAFFGNVFVDLSPNLAPVATLNGQLLDSDGDRLIYQTPSADLVLRTLASPPTTTVLKQGTALCWGSLSCGEEAWLTPTGAALKSEALQSVIDFADAGTVQTSFATGHQATHVHAGSFAGRWGGAEGNQITIVDTRASTSSTIAGTELSLTDDGTLVHVLGASEIVVRSMVDAGVVAFSGTGNERVASPALTSSGLAYLYSADQGTSYALRVGTQTIPSVARAPFAVRDGWAAYSKTEGTTKAIYVTAPDAGSERLTFWNEQSTVDAIGGNGQVAYVHDERLHIVGPGMGSTWVGSSRARAFWAKGQWFVIEGNTLFNVQPDAGIASCTSVVDAGTPDSGTAVDAGMEMVSDAGTEPPQPRSGCQAVSGQSVLAGLAMLLALRRRRT